MRIRKMFLTLAVLAIALSVTASAALAQMDKLKNTTPEERAGALRRRRCASSSRRRWRSAEEA